MPDQNEYDTGERLHSPAREQLEAQAGATFGEPPEYEAADPIGERPEFGGLTVDDIESDVDGAYIDGDHGSVRPDDIIPVKHGDADYDEHEDDDADEDAGFTTGHYHGESYHEHEDGDYDHESHEDGITADPSKDDAER